MTKELVIGGTVYRVEATERGGRWTAVAREPVRGAACGPSLVAASEQDAIERLSAWLEWQHEHAAALEALQEAERAYQRMVAGSAFVTGPEGPSAIELQKEALGRLEEARLRLDEVRQKKPQ